MVEIYRTMSINESLIDTIVALAFGYTTVEMLLGLYEHYEYIMFKKR